MADQEPVTPPPTEERPPVRIRWDDSRMQSGYANVCNVTSTREEVTLLFGTNQVWRAGQREVTVELTNRLMLNPHAAKRLSLLLNQVISEYETRFGTLALTPDVPETVTKGGK